MSNAASLASVKNRRSRPPQTVQFQQQQKQQQSPQQNMLLNTNNANKEPITPLNLLKKHDVKIYCLEKRLEEYNQGANLNNNQQEYVTKQDLELLKFDNSVTSKVDNKLSNVVDTNTKDIVAIKLAVTQFTKSFGELNSQIQMLKATVLSQGNEIEELLKMKDDYYTLLDAQNKDNEEQVEGNVVDNVVDNDADGESVKFKINEKN